MQVRVHAFAKRVGADVALEHPQNGGAFLIGDDVERLVDLRRRLDVGMDRPRRLQRVERHCGLRFLLLVDVDHPVAMLSGERLVRHPRREAFVQPDVVPPLHRDEVAEPLVRHLVREDLGDEFPRLLGRRNGVGEQERLAIEDRGGVLHGPRREIRDADDVELLERIFDAVVAVVEPQVLLGRVQRERRQLLLVGRCAHTDRNRVGAPFTADEVPHCERHEVRGHLRRDFEYDRMLPAARTRRIGRHRAVRDRVVPLVYDGGEGERRLHRGFVERGKHASRVGGLELRYRVATVVRLAQIQPAELVVQHTPIGDADLRLARR